MQILLLLMTMARRGGTSIGQMMAQDLVVNADRLAEMASTSGK
jgi:hypothetical protein